MMTELEAIRWHSDGTHILFCEPTIVMLMERTAASIMGAKLVADAVVEMSEELLALYGDAERTPPTVREAFGKVMAAVVTSEPAHQALWRDMGDLLGAMTAEQDGLIFDLNHERLDRTIAEVASLENMFGD